MPGDRGTACTGQSKTLIALTCAYHVYCTKQCSQGAGDAKRRAGPIRLWLFRRTSVSIPRRPPHVQVSAPSCRCAKRRSPGGLRQETTAHGSGSAGPDGHRRAPRGRRDGFADRARFAPRTRPISPFASTGACSSGRSMWAMCSKPARSSPGSTRRTSRTRCARRKPTWPRLRRC